jgi:hypothetical protein
MTARERFVFALLVALGSAQMVADVSGWPGLKVAAAATQVSPAMRVFTAHAGFETYASRFRIEWRDATHGVRSIELDPATYARVRGPYNRRNVYGAALAYGPLLAADPRTAAMHASVMHYAFCKPGTMRDELSIPHGAAVAIEVVPRRPDARLDLPTRWEVDCGA